MSYRSNELPASDNFFGVTELISATIIITILLAASLWMFHWMLELESYSRSVLNHEETPPHLLPHLRFNPIMNALTHMQVLNKELLKDKRELTEQIRKTTYVDEVTELGNKSFFKAEFQVRLFHHDSPENGLLVLFSFVDTDFEGIDVLTETRVVEIAHIIKGFAEKYDDALVARLKEQDFVLLLPNQTRKDVDQLCRKVIHQLERSVFDKTSIKEHFVDIGISVYQQGFDYYKVMAEADMALRNAQLQGGNCWFMYGEALSANKVRGHLRWSSFLQRILDKRQIQLYGQRIVHFGDSNIVHSEVFARIEDGKDILAADTFLPMASRCGLASDFDRQVIDTLIKHCLHSDTDIQDQRFSINLFISSLLDERFVGWLIGKLSSFPELCRHFIFEIKESYINQHKVQLKTVMEQIGSLGIQWCVERFGAPDEDLDYLESLPIAMVKIDRRVINNIHSSKSQQLLVKSLQINLKSHDIEVFAEGVEDVEDAEYVESIGFRGAQGYYFAKPRRLGGIEKLLKVI